MKIDIIFTKLQKTITKFYLYAIAFNFNFIELLPYVLIRAYMELKMKAIYVLQLL
jgi:hypothetical protein